MLSNSRFFYFMAIMVMVGLMSIFCSTPKRTTADDVRASFNDGMAQLQSTVENNLLKAAVSDNAEEIKQAFLLARSEYKSIEYYMEYFFPSTSVLINGAPIDEIELGENLVTPPSGFQVMEELVFATELSDEDREELVNEVRKMILNLKRVARYHEQIVVTDAQIFDAMRLEIFRIISLGITGFDTPAALQSLPETISALSGVQAVLECYDQSEESSISVKKAVEFVQQSSDYDTFDRLTFITRYLQPVSKNIDKLRRIQNISTVAGSSALADSAIDLFQDKAFDVNNFVGNHTEYISDGKVALGKALFNSTVLSNSANISCASCHHESKAFTDGEITAAGIATEKGVRKTIALLRNTPTLSYAGFQRGFFYDMKAGTLEDQVLDVVHNKNEMDGSLDQAAVRLNKQGNYADLFSKAYNGDSKANSWKIQHALASYIRSLSPFSSRFDKYMHGDTSQLNTKEKHGFNLFMGKAKCGSCHFAPLFNGTQAPLFAKSEAEVLGVPSKPDTVNAQIDGDAGRFALSPYPQYRYAFKTTTVRNIAKTAPYMHNGVYKTLEEVLDFYNRGGGAGIGIDLDNQTLSPDPLNLTQVEVNSIIAFLHTLTDVEEI